MSKQSKWRYIGSTEQRSTRWKCGIAGWTRPPTRKTITIPWYYGVCLGVCCWAIAALGVHVYQAMHAHHASREAQTAREDVQARTLTLGPGEAMQITLGQGGYGVTMRDGRTYYAVMDPSCQVHRQQQEPGQVVWRGEPRVVTHNGVVSALVTNESIVELPERGER